MSSTAGNDTADDSMDEIKADPEQRPQGTSPPPFLGSHFEAGAEGKGNRLRSTHVVAASAGPGAAAGPVGVMAALRHLKDSKAHLGGAGAGGGKAT